MLLDNVLGPHRCRDGSGGCPDGNVVVISVPETTVKRRRRTVKLERSCPRQVSSPRSAFPARPCRCCCVPTSSRKFAVGSGQLELDTVEVRSSSLLVPTIQLIESAQSRAAAFLPV
jgi:hypothetical protein